MDKKKSEQTEIKTNMGIMSLLMCALTAVEGIVIAVTANLCYNGVFAEGLEAKSVFKAGYLMMGTIVVFFLMITICIEFGQRSINQILFFLILASSNFDLIGSVFVFMGEGTPASLFAGAIIVLIANPLTVTIFWFYQRNLCLGDGYTRTKAEVVIIIAALLDLGQIFYESYKGYLFSFDEQNNYIEGPYIGFTYIYPILILVLCIIQNFTSRISRRRHIALFLFAVTPLILAVIALLAGDSLYSHTAFVTGILIIYVGVQADSKLETYIQKESLDFHRKMLEEDALTHLLSRYAYSRDVDSVDSAKETTGDTVVFAMDINGLKEANDTKGHGAGDELIIGAADCIRQALSRHGRCYRTGGDEFVAVLNISADRIDEIRNELQNTVKEWHGKLIDELSISIGVASAADNPEKNIQQLIRDADSKMYDDKERYYLMTGKNRRKH